MASCRMRTTSIVLLFAEYHLAADYREGRDRLQVR